MSGQSIVVTGQAFPEREELQACLDLLDGLRPFVESGVADMYETYNVALAHARQTAAAYRKAVLGPEAPEHVDWAEQPGTLQE